MNERVLRISCEGESLLGILHLPAGSDTAQPMGVLILVGGPQYRVGSHRQFLLMARSLAADGYPVLRFDFRGMGDSSGARPSFEDVADDIRAAADSMAKEVAGLESLCLFGLCDGASAALLHCNSDPRVRALVLANPWVRTDATEAKAVIQHYYGRRFLQRSFWLKLVSGRLNIISSLRGLLDSARKSRTAAGEQGNYVSRMNANLSRFRGNVLVVLSENDLVAREFHAHSASSDDWQKSIESGHVTMVGIAGSDHTFSARPMLKKANAAVTDFLFSIR